jgi:2-polyprenyl-3-methyl-5-hydroxy-6-metoxy-1,4-benzoquinol methylase
MYTPDQIVEMYCKEDYDQHPFFAYDMQSVENSRNARFHNFLRALAKIESVVGVGKLLDVACGSGTFLALAQKHGWETAGIEISTALCEQCKRNTNATIYNVSFEDADLPQGYYDCITFWDIIEHTLDPVQFVAKAKTHLKPNGIMLFCTPDEDSMLARVAWTLYQATASHYNYPALALHPRYHTFFFSRASLAKLLRQQQMTAIHAYSQEAFFEHSPLASQLQKKVIGIIEKVSSVFDASYECVMFAKLDGFDSSAIKPGDTLK